MSRARAGLTFLLFLAVPVGAIACDDTTVVDVKDYDQTCEVDADCVMVKNGAACCGCPNASINEKDVVRYQEDQGTCDEFCDVVCVNNVAAVCVDGTCGTETK